MHVHGDIKKRLNLSKQDRLWNMLVSITAKLASACVL